MLAEVVFTVSVETPQLTVLTPLMEHDWRKIAYPGGPESVDADVLPDGSVEFPITFWSQVSLAAVEEVAAAGADAVMSYLLLGFEDARAEALEIERNARLARACERSGLVLMIEPRYAGERIHSARKTETAIMQLYCRISAEVGADLVKVIWPGSSEAMNALAESCPAPLLVAGGERNASKEGEVFDVARCAINAGASGLVFGRKVYQAPNPGKIVAKLREIVDLPGDRQPD